MRLFGWRDARPLTNVERAGWRVDAGLRLLRSNHPEAMERAYAGFVKVLAERGEFIACGKLDPSEPIAVEVRSVWGSTRYVTEYPAHDAGRSSQTGFTPDAQAFFRQYSTPVDERGADTISATVAHSAVELGSSKRERADQTLRDITASRAAVPLLADLSFMHAASASDVAAIVRSQQAGAAIGVLDRLELVRPDAVADIARAQAEGAGVERAYTELGLNGCIAATRLLMSAIALAALPDRPLGRALSLTCGASDCTHTICNAHRQRLLQALPGPDFLRVPPARRDFCAYAVSRAATLEAVLAAAGDDFAGCVAIAKALERLWSHGYALHAGLREAPSTLAFYQQHS